MAGTTALRILQRILLSKDLAFCTNIAKHCKRPVNASRKQQSMPHCCSCTRRIANLATLNDGGTFEAEAYDSIPGCDYNKALQNRLSDFTGALRNSFREIRKSVASKFPSCFPKHFTAPTMAQPYQSIPGPKGLPFLGSALDYIIKFSPMEFDIALRHRHTKYGTIFREKILNEELVYTSDPNDVRLLVQNEGPAPLRPNLEVMVESRIQEGLPVGITAMQGKEWLRNRNAINAAISLPRAVKKFRQPQEQIAKDLVHLMKKKQDKATLEVPEFEKVIIRWALESIAVVLLDTRLGLLNPDSTSSNPAAEGLRECMDVFFDYGARLTFGFPLWKLWNTKDWKIFRKAQTDEFNFAGIFVERKLKELNEKKETETLKPASGCPFHQTISNHPNSNQSSTKPQKKNFENFSCLLDHVINHKDLTKKEAVTVCLELLAGGIDTTSTAAVFTLYQLAKNPEHQDHLRNLLKSEELLKSSETTEFSKYLKACIWESLRLNPLTYANQRTTEKDLVLSGFSVPKGTVVRYTTHLMNLQNEEYFFEPKKFVPDRWLHRNSPHRCKKQFTFTPFGHGARQCPGRRVAEQELDLLFRQILSTFKVGYKYGEMGVNVRLFNGADKPARFDFTPLSASATSPADESKEKSNFLQEKSIF